MDGARARAEGVDLVFGAIIIGFGSGIVFESLTAVPFFIFLTLGALSVVAGFCTQAQHRLRIFCIGIFLFSSVLGMMRFDMARPDASQYYAGEHVTLSGVIEEPSVKKSGQSFTLDTPSGVNINVSTKTAPPLLYGDEVTVTGKLQNPMDFMTDQGTEFDYISYLYKDDILYQMQYAKVAVIAHGKGNWLIAHLIPLQNRILASFQRVLPPNEANLLAGLDLGAKSAIDPQFRDALVTTGTIHIIALSGYNVTIVATFLKAILACIPFLGSIGASIGGAIGIVLFVAMTGMQSSAIRAGIMALIALFAEGSGRAYNAFRALVFAGFLMILWDPKYLVYDVSFQLSFLATLGIIFATPILAQKFSRVPEKLLFILPLRELMSATLGAQAGVLPFILYKMGTLSLISLPANILVLPVIPFAMGIGALAGFIGMFSTAFAFPVSWITYWLLRYITWIITLLARVPYASVVINDFPILLCLLMYFVLIALLYRTWHRQTKTTPTV